MWQVSQYRDFTGGENRRVLSELIAPNQVQLARNCIITPEGALESRYGKTKIFESSVITDSIRAIWRWEQSDGTRYLTFVAGTKMFSMEWDGESTFDDEDLTEVYEFSSSTTKVRARVWKDRLIVSDGVDNPFQFDGETATDLGGTPPKFNIFTVYASKLVCVDIDNPSQIRFSGLEDYDSWNALDVYNIRSNDSDVITALEAQSQGLLICKKNSSWALFGFDRFDIQISQGPIANVGAISQDAIQNGLFMGRDNFYIASLPAIQPMVDTHGILIQNYKDEDTESMTSLYSQKDGYALMSIRGTVYCLNGKFNGAITTWDDLNAGAMAYIQDTGCVLVGDADSPTIYCLNGTTDDGIVFLTDIVCPYLNMGSPREKVFRNVHHRFQIINGGYDLLMSADVDFARLVQFSTTQFLTIDALDWGVDSWATADWGSPNDTRSDFVHWLHGERGTYMAVGFRTASRIKFLGYTVKFKEVGNII